VESRRAKSSDLTVDEFKRYAVSFEDAIDVGLKLRSTFFLVVRIVVAVRLRMISAAVELAWISEALVAALRLRRR
jgi:hypothetical protein